MSVWPIAAAVGAQAIGSMVTNAQNVHLSRAQMDWEEKMSNTSYQRGMADMKAAGLNPMLAYEQGGATTPNVQAPQLSNPMAGVTQGVSEAVQAETVAPTVSKLTAEKQAVLAQAQKDLSQADYNKLLGALAVAQKTKEAALTQGISMDNANRSAYIQALHSLDPILVKRFEIISEALHTFIMGAAAGAWLLK